ncbi:MAG: lamin tail domain-containing protein [Verrucomicrobiae bacterium]|nr:lamin tail domain-containing protein [Verrucomicrobiae bacterium]
MTVFKWLRWCCTTAVLVALPCTSPAQIVINEVLADNNAAVRNGDGFPKSYVELYNPTANAVSLHGWFLTNNTNVNERFKYAFPPGTVIQPFEFLIVWCNKTTNGPGLYTGFDLKKATDEVGLYRGPTNAPTLVDYVRFGFQIEDLSISRWPDGSGAWRLTIPTPGAENAAPIPLGTPRALVFNEWLANTPTTDDWFEIFNPATNPPVNMEGLVIQDNGGAAKQKVIPPLSFISSNGFQLFWANDNGSARAPANECNFRLGGDTGDVLILLPYVGAAAGEAIHRVIVAAQPENVSDGLLPDGNTNNLVRFMVNRSTPGKSNFQLITNIVINEVLAHTDPPLVDAIEFFNLTSEPYRLDHFYLSNSEDNPRKYQFPTNTVVPPNGFLVVYEKDFNPDGTGNAPSFTLNSAHGDSVVLCSATNRGGPLTGFRLSKSFEATANGVSLGRHVKSDGKTDFVPMSRLSFGTSVTANDPPEMMSVFLTGRGETNPYPLVGPIIISEIMYHPPDIIQGTNRLDDSLNEYIELTNLASTNVPLFTPTEPTNRWSLNGGIEFTFPQGVVLPARSSLLVVNFDPVTNLTQLAIFRAKYNIPANFNRIYGPYKGKLANSTMLIQLIRPDLAQRPPHPDAGYVPQLLVEKVRYEDQAPWPTNFVDGGGNSLHRIAPLYANDETSWFGAPPSPGVFFTANPPSIVQPPQNQTVLQGGTATFNVNATGDAPLAYQWWFNNAVLSGRTTASLVLSNVQPANAGTYFVTVSNATATITSAPATLTVVTAPTIPPPQRNPQGAMQLVFSTAPGFTYDIQGSLNLSNWTTLATYSNTGSQVNFTVPMTNGWLFLRARVRP